MSYVFILSLKKCIKMQLYRMEIIHHIQDTHVSNGVNDPHQDSKREIDFCYKWYLPLRFVQSLELYKENNNQSNIFSIFCLTSLESLLIKLLVSLCIFHSTLKRGRLHQFSLSVYKTILWPWPALYSSCSGTRLWGSGLKSLAVGHADTI